LPELRCNPIGGGPSRKKEEGGEMLVENWMSKEVVTVETTDSMHHATQLMQSHSIRTLPVLKKGKLVGILTDRDIKRASASDATALEIHELLYLLDKVRVGEIMTRDPITVPPDYTLEEASQILLRNKISGLPVLDATGHLVGIITQADLFRAMVSMTGVAKKGFHFAFLLEDRPGSIKEVTDVIRAFNGRLVSILSSYGRAPSGFRHVYVRAIKVDRERIPDLLKALQAMATLLYFVDHEAEIREIYTETPSA
jgi:acetoin utilization protein AcuB